MRTVRVGRGATYAAEDGTCRVFDGPGRVRRISGSLSKFTNYEKRHRYKSITRHMSASQGDPLEVENPYGGPNMGFRNLGSCVYTSFRAKFPT